MDDSFWGTLGFSAGLAVWIWAWFVRKKLCTTNPAAESDGRMTTDGQVAIDTLRKFGYDKSEAETLVHQALANVPDGNYEILINVALKK